MIWESDELVEWLNPYDAFFSLNLLVESGGGFAKLAFIEVVI